MAECQTTIVLKLRSFEASYVPLSGVIKLLPLVVVSVVEQVSDVAVEYAVVESLLLSMISSSSKVVGVVG